MGLHGDPDDYGLPKVDIVVPDDARELDRDVLAYRRELRQKRRRERWRRLARPFTRYGIAAPFIASAVLVALISGVLMTVVSPRPTTRAVQVPPTGVVRHRPGDPGGALPTGTLIVNGRGMPIDTLVNVAGVVLIVPRDCRCDATVTHVAQQAVSQGVQTWVIADGRTGKDADDVRRLADTVPRGDAIPAEDPGRVLSTTFRAAGLTAVLVGPDKIVRDIVRGVLPDRNLTPALQALHTPG
ncbi:hypothetical protein NE235_03475 [Actinoallomurus spadix]|uniref:Uncharacterized protein n=1 Tax=Actinoallomurus spadix TaxID=79912 RepID=A0ABN0XM02_9ACTN|nr:hypothetical protein [Actinoallomurus spadix]MCO5985166.1 hypothetical protein [Actinoallomurus spadix]